VTTLRAAWLIAVKDLRLEFRSRTALLSAFVFAVLVLAIFNFARDATVIGALDLAPGVLWVTFCFAGLLGLNRAFGLERDNRTIDGLMMAPVSRTAVFLGKAISNLALVAIVEAAALPLFALFFGADLRPVLGPLLVVIALATGGFVVLGTLLSAIAVSTRFAELLLPILSLPLLVPPIIAAVQLTSRLLAQRPMAEISPWLRLLVAYDIVVVVMALLTFEHTVDE